MMIKKFKTKEHYGILKDYKEVYSQYRSRSLQLQLLCVVVLLLLFFKLFQLQVVENAKLQLFSDNNRLSISSIEPVRGRILDRNGRVLADNKITRFLFVNPILNKQQRIDRIYRLSKIVGFDADEALKNYNKYVQRFGKKNNVPIVRLNDKNASKFANISFTFPFFELGYQVLRYYPYKQHAVHLLGYVGALTEEDKNDWQLFENEKDTVGFRTVGKTGLERYYDKLLRGKIGLQTVELNAKRNKVREISITPAQEGEDLQINIDIDLQIFLDYLLAPFKGASVMLDVQTGEVLAMTSSPMFDNNLLVENRATGFKLLASREDKPFLNRATHGLYPPASTIKPFVALAALENKLIVPRKKIFTEPYFLVPEETRRFHDWKKGGHGWVDLYKAMAQSSDVYFYKVAYELGVDKLYEYLSQFPFGVSTGIDLPGESIGVLPNREWKYGKFGGQWLPGETVIYGIGQGYFLTTPLQLVLSVSSIANYGQILRPHLTNTEFNVENETLGRISTYSEKNWNIVREAMLDTVRKKYGSAFKAGIGSAYRFAGKTGTAQIISLAQNPEKRDVQKEKLPKNLRDHSIFVGYAPASNPRVAIVVLIENGESGGRLAAPLAKAALDKYFELFSWSYVSSR